MKFKNLLEVLTFFNNKEVAIEYLIKWRWHGKPRCPHCKNDKKKIYEYKGKEHRFKCSKCKKQFSVLKGTIFENTSIPLHKWFAVMYILTSHKKGISSYQVARDLSITQKSAWFMLQRIRHALAIGNIDTQLEDTVEIDETYVGGKNKNRHYDKKVRNSQGRSWKDKTPVLGLLQRNGELRVFKISNVERKTLLPIIKANIKKGSKVMTDEWRSYSRLSKRYDHRVVYHGRGQYVEGINHTNTMEGGWSLLKRSITGIYHQVSRKHLDKYLDEFAFRYNTREMEDVDRFESVFSSIERRLSFKELTTKV